MIETIYLQAIILLVLVWVFESKIFPQAIIMFLALILLLNEVTTSTQATIQHNIPIFILYASIMVYAGLQMTKDEEQ